MNLLTRLSADRDVGDACICVVVGVGVGLQRVAATATRRQSEMVL